MLELRDINKSYSLRGEIQIPVLSGLELQLLIGDSLTVYGANGSGKTTLLNIINGGDNEFEGEVFFNNKKLNNIPYYKKSNYIITVRQKRGEDLPDTLTLFEIYALLRKSIGLDSNKKSIKDMLISKLSSFGIGMEKLIDKQLKSLSGGEYQLFNMLLVTEKINKNKPCILLLDEHTSHLDPIITEKVLNITKELISKKNVISIIISHNIDKGIFLSPKSAVLKNGKLIFIDSTNDDELLKNEIRRKLMTTSF